MVCDDGGYNGQYVASSRHLKIKYQSKSSVVRNNVMSLIITAFHEGKIIMCRIMR